MKKLMFRYDKDNKIVFVKDYPESLDLEAAVICEEGAYYDDDGDLMDKGGSSVIEIAEVWDDDDGKPVIGAIMHDGVYFFETKPVLT